MQLTKNFQLAEFESHDGAPTPANVVENLKELAFNLQVLRDYLKTSITITSGYRSPAHNKAIGGAKFSQHMEGKAADIKCSKYTPEQVLAAVEKLIAEGKVNFGGVGIYNSWVHVDTRKTKARWDFRKHK